MLGLMQDWPLTVDRILTHAARWHAQQKIITRTPEGPIESSTYAEIEQRARRLSASLHARGIRLGDRVATLAWNTQHHFEAWYAIMGIGAICHTLNPRLHPDQLVQITNHAGARLLFADGCFAPLADILLRSCPGLEGIVFLTAQATMPASPVGAVSIETLIEADAPPVAWGAFDERTACGLCYTSGTTGAPKGVLYSHRSNVLQTMAILPRDVLDVSARDVVLPIVPMYHANAWGLAFAAPASGASLVMPGAKMDGASLLELIDAHGVTIIAGVPTVLQSLFEAGAQAPHRMKSLRRILVGGAACPQAMMAAYSAHGIEVIHAWGMTETSPVGTVCMPTHATAEEEVWQRARLKQGRPMFGIDLKLTDDAGATLPHDSERPGHLKVRGPWVVDTYYSAAASALDVEGFFDTGDIATIDANGFIQITDRDKDVIKSGGEWISSVELERLAAGHPKVFRAAVIGMPHPRWDERPLLIVQLREGQQVAPAELLDFYAGKVAKWWIPDEVLFVDEIPLGATGKIDKRALRALYLKPDSARSTASQ